MPHINLKAQNPVRVQQGLQELEECTSPELAAHLNMPIATVTAVLSELYRRSMVHICAWSRNKQGTPIKVYAWGEGDDAPQPIKTSKPKKVTVEEVQLPFPRCDEAAAWLRNPI